MQCSCRQSKYRFDKRFETSDLQTKAQYGKAARWTKNIAFSRNACHAWFLNLLNHRLESFTSLAIRWHNLDVTTNFYEHSEGIVFGYSIVRSGCCIERKIGIVFLSSYIDMSTLYFLQSYWGCLPWLYTYTCPFIKSHSCSVFLKITRLVSGSVNWGTPQPYRQTCFGVGRL